MNFDEVVKVLLNPGDIQFDRLGQIKVISTPGQLQELFYDNRNPEIREINFGMITDELDLLEDLFENNGNVELDVFAVACRDSISKVITDGRFNILQRDLVEFILTFVFKYSALEIELADRVPLIARHYDAVKVGGMPLEWQDDVFPSGKLLTFMP